MAKIYYSKRTQSKISKAKRHRWHKTEETDHKLPRCLSWWSHTGRIYVLEHWTVATCVKCRLPEQLMADTVLEVSHVGALCLAQTKFQILREKQVFTIYDMVCTKSLSRASHYHLGKLLSLHRKLFTIHVARCQPLLEACSEEHQPNLLPAFCTYSKGDWNKSLTSLSQRVY